MARKANTFPAPHENLESEIQHEQWRLENSKRGIIISLTALGAVFLFFLDAAKNLEDVASRSRILFFGGIYIYLAIQAILTLPRLWFRAEFSPFGVAAGLGPPWYSMTIEALATYVVFVSPPDFTWIIPRPLIQSFSVILLVFLVLSVVQTFAIRGSSTFRLEVLSNNLQTPTRIRAIGISIGSIFLLLIIVFRIMIATKFVAEELILPDLMATLHALAFASTISVGLGILTFFARQLHKYDVKKIVFLKGLRRAALVAKPPPQKLEQEFANIMFNLSSVERDYKQARSNLITEYTAMSSIDFVSHFYLIRWGAYRQIVLFPLLVEKNS